MNPITLRDYQQEAVTAILSAVSAGKNPVACLPTGSGKSLIAASVCAALPGRTLVLSHRKELLLQDQAALARYAPDVSSGIYSAGLNRRDTQERVIFGGVASVYRRLEELGKFNTLLVDEAHLISPADSSGLMYNTILRSLAIPRVGLTATPYRLDSGVLYEGDGAWFDDLCVHIRPSALIEQGYLSPLVGVGGRQQLDTDGVHVRQGDFVTAELSQLACAEDRVAKAVDELLRKSEGRRSGIVFAIDVTHTTMIAEELQRRGESVAMITGKTPADEREETLALYKACAIRWVVNCQVLTTGFDAPATDAVALFRPTLSKGLYVQMVGRGMRLADRKSNCLVLDFGGNILRHGPLDLFQHVQHEKTEKQERQERSRARRAREKQYLHATKALGGDPLSGEVEGVTEFQVLKMQYHLLPAKSKPGKKNVAVDYCCEGVTVRQWLCPEYTNGARWHTEQWFARRGLKAPYTAPEAAKLAWKAISPESISVYYETAKDGRTYPRVAIERFPDDGREEEKQDIA